MHRPRHSLVRHPGQCAAEIRDPHRAARAAAEWIPAQGRDDDWRSGRGERTPSPAHADLLTRNIRSRMGGHRRIGLLGGSFNPAHDGPSRHQPRGLDLSRSRRGLVAGLAAKSVEAGQRHGAVRRAPEERPDGGAITRRSGSPTSRPRSAPATPPTPCESSGDAFSVMSFRVADGGRQSGANRRPGGTGHESFISRQLRFSTVLPILLGQ